MKNSPSLRNLNQTDSEIEVDGANFVHLESAQLRNLNRNRPFGVGRSFIS